LAKLWPGHRPLSQLPPFPVSPSPNLPPFFASPMASCGGCATASYQIEGAVNEDGRGQTNWDVFAHTPGKTFQGDTGDVADDSYHLYKVDVQLLKSLA